MDYENIIAAAPDLYNCLDRMVSAMVAYECDVDSSPTLEHKALMRDARNALAIARGETKRIDCPVPPIPAEWVKLWDQPDPKNFSWNISEREVEVSETDFNALLDYSRSTPSGVYQGKMWKSKNGEEWNLRFFGLACKEGTNEIDDKRCSNNTYKIKLRK